MTTTRTWIGGGNNESNNPADWQPNGAPMPGDTLVVPANTPTLNLDHAIATVQITGQSGVAHVDLGTGNIINLAAPAAYGTSIDVGISGPGNIVHADNVDSGLAQDTFDLTGPNAGVLFTGNLSSSGGGIEGQGTFTNDGTITWSSWTISPEVVGGGTLNFISIHDGPGGGEIKGAMIGQTVNIEGGTPSPVGIQVDQPQNFHPAIVTMRDESSIDLAGLSADSYDFKNDLLTLYKGNTPIYTLRLTDASTDGESIFVTDGHAPFGVGYAAGVSVATWSPAFGPPPTTGLLPQHTIGA